MPRKLLIRINDCPYHICTRTNNKDYFSITMKEAWDSALHALDYAHSKCPIYFHAFVLMSNHYHLLITTPGGNIDTFMLFFNKRFSDKVRFQSHKINHVFGGPYNWSIIQDETYLYNVTRYIFQNPLRVNLVERAEDYNYSSLYYEFREKKFPIPITPSFEFSNTSEHLLKWYNELPTQDEYSLVQKALRRSTFTPAKDSKTDKPYQLSHPTHFS